MSRVEIGAPDAPPVQVSVARPKVSVTVARPQVSVSAPTADPVQVTVSRPVVQVSAPVLPPVAVTVARPQLHIGASGGRGPQGEPGPPGPPGPPGSGVIAAQHVHIQAVLASTWTVTHGLGKHPEVTCEDGAGAVIHGSISYPDDDTAVVGFAFAITGRANCT